MSGEEVVLVVFALLMFGGLTVLWLAVTNRRAQREMEHRERLAMIERGLIPAPEADPQAFEAAAGFEPSRLRGDRWRTAGITMIGLGLALLVLLSFTVGNPSLGFGIGGAFAVLGAAVLVNGTQMARQDLLSPRRRGQGPRPPGVPGA